MLPSGCCCTDRLNLARDEVTILSSRVALGRRVLSVFSAIGLVALLITQTTPKHAYVGTAGTTLPVCASLTVGTLNVAGDPVGGGNQDWINLQFTNNGASTCTIQGWPTLAVLATGDAQGGSPLSTVTDITANNFGPIASGPVTLSPGAAAIASVEGNSIECISQPWALQVAAPGLNLSSLASSTSALTTCLSSTLAVSPIYPESTLTSEISSSQSQVGEYPLSSEPQPVACTQSAQPLSLPKLPARTAMRL